MGNTRAGRLVLLGAAACMLAVPFGAAAADAAAAGAGAAPHSATAISADTADIRGHGWADSEPVAEGPVTHLLLPPDHATSPSQHAQITFDAWVRADLAELEKRGTRAVADMLAARPWSWDDEWDEEKDCEGAAGSTYCTWTGRFAQPTLRVANQRAANDRPHAVTEAVLEPVPGDAIALWPLTTQEQADNTQEQVDKGHSPWLLYADTVATLYAEGELGWSNPRAKALGTGVFRVSDPSSGAEVELTLDQPARTGDTGIWAVTSLRSARS
jgi:hypothetical protein